MRRSVGYSLHQPCEYTTAARRVGPSSDSAAFCCPEGNVKGIGTIPRDCRHKNYWYAGAGVLVNQGSMAIGWIGTSTLPRAQVKPQRILFTKSVSFAKFEARLLSLPEPFGSV